MAFSWIVDKGGRKAIVPLIGAVCGVHFISKFAWLLYDETSFAFKWCVMNQNVFLRQVLTKGNRFAVAISYIEVSLSPINYSVANLACAADAEERAFIVSSMLAISTAFRHVGAAGRVPDLRGAEVFQWLRYGGRHASRFLLMDVLRGLVFGSGGPPTQGEGRSSQKSENIDSLT